MVHFELCSLSFINLCINLLILKSAAHVQNKCFALKFKFRRNPSKFPTFIYKENPSSFFHFSFRATFIFPFMNALVYVDIDQGGHSLGKK